MFGEKDLMGIASDACLGWNARLRLSFGGQGEQRGKFAARYPRRITPLSGISSISVRTQPLLCVE